jgi:hypothetical protein
MPPHGVKKNSFKKGKLNKSLATDDEADEIIFAPNAPRRAVGAVMAAGSRSAPSRRLGLEPPPEDSVFEASAQIHEATGTSDKQRAFEVDKFNKELALEWEKLQVEREKIKLEEKALKVRELEAKALMTGHKVRLTELELSRRGFHPGVELAPDNSVGRAHHDDAGHSHVEVSRLQQGDIFRSSPILHPSPSPEPIPISNVTIWPDDEDSTRALHR